MGFTSINSGKFAVFHDQGYTAYNPDDCLKHRSVHSDFGYFKFIPDNLDGPLRLCDDGQDCSWGDVANVKNSFLYVSQPAMNRVVVIETSKNWIPVQVTLALRGSFKRKDMMMVMMTTVMMMMMKIWRVFTCIQLCTCSRCGSMLTVLAVRQATCREVKAQIYEQTYLIHCLCPAGSELCL